MINPTCGTCVFRVAKRRELPRTCAHDGLPAVGGQPCRIGKWAPRRAFALPFTDRLRRGAARKMEVELL